MVVSGLVEVGAPFSPQSVCSSDETIVSTHRHPAHPVSVLGLHPVERDTRSVVTNCERSTVHCDKK